MKSTQLKKRLLKLYDEKTCHYKFLWNPKNPTTGHCRVTALIVQDYFGGDILYSWVKGNKKWDHYWNKLPNGKEIDLTKDQFPKNTKFIKPKIISRKEAMKSKRTQKGYKLLKKRLK